MNKKIRMIRTLFIAAVVCQLSIGHASAQSPRKMSYQAVVRNASNELTASTNVGMRISILQGTADGTAVYIETHAAKTNVNGLVSIEIGGGTILSGDFAAIDWSAGPYFVKTETDPNGGVNYTVTGISQLLSVPYALYAQNAGTVELSPSQIESLKGERGLQGVQGPAGKDGESGLSAFELWKALDGNGGKSETDFFASLKGADGMMSFADLTEEQKSSLKGDAGPAGKDGLTTSVNGVVHVNGAITLTKSDIGLGNVENTADIDKPVSTATQSALDTKADKATTLAGYGITDAATKAYVDELLRQIEELQIVTGIKPKDVDGNIYKTVTIGTQTWFAENLKVTHYSDSSPIPNVTDNTAWAALTDGALCDYANDPANSVIYGKLYNWHAAASGKLCPKGWHVPTETEWGTLIQFLGETVAANKLKEAGTAHWTSSYNNADVTNETGFTALPGGARYDTDFSGIGGYGYWWSSSQYDDDDARGRRMIYASTDVGQITSKKLLGLSIRCLKD